MASSVWRNVRILFLLFILAVAAWSNWYDRLSTTDWDETLLVGVFPIAEPEDSASARYIATLSERDLDDIEAFFDEEAARYGIGIRRPVDVRLYPSVAERPPHRDPEGGVFATMWWSLKMRMYARRTVLASGLSPPQVRIFVHFHDPDFTATVPHSVGLQKGLVGVVHAFAEREMAGSNNVVIAHELLHTLGATDKYHPVTLAPLFPQGYAEPEREPRYPQQFAEIMAGRIAVSPTELDIPRSLDDVLVGEATALEIRWVRP
jgi:hypothetical protein